LSLGQWCTDLRIENDLKRREPLPSTGDDRISVVHVDDDSDILAIAKTALEVLGSFSVTSFSSGGAALKELPSLSPDLIILDLSMPEMDGRETFCGIKKITALEGVPIVFLTAENTPAVQRELIALGATQVISKPFDPLQLHLEISKYVASA